jgi:uncharacterized protein with HEPN domain
MKPRDVRSFLWDIGDACDAIEQIISAKTLDDYLSDLPTRFAIERAFEIIGEALRNVVELDPLLFDRITDAPKIVAFRNRIAHHYWGVIAQTVWTIAQSEVPILNREVRAILSTLPPP